MSFVELFEDIEKYIDSKMSRWKFVLRLKRGLIETSEPGGLYKDQCYLEGAVQFLQNRHTIDIMGLFCGKISFEDLAKPKIQKVLNKESIKLPTFMQDMERYMGALDIIARTNHIAAITEWAVNLEARTNIQKVISDLAPWARLGRLSRPLVWRPTVS